MRDSDAMAEPTLAAGTQVGEYVVGERLGVGGFSEVFRVTHPVIGREAALKVLHAKYCNDPVALGRFVDEARAMNKIEHPGIADVFGFGELADGRAYLVMELLVGSTLQRVLTERRRLPLAEALPILRGIAEAVDAAHAAGIAHRDLKPDNVFVLPDGTIKLIDFGIAKLARDGSTPATETGSVLGTPQYMSPEQCRGRGSDTRSDAYSFGALAYHVLAGELPFTGEPLEMALHHLNDRPQAPSKRCRGLTPRIDHVVLALLEKDPALRPLPLADAVKALEGSTGFRRRWSGRTKVAVGAPLLAAVGIGGIALALASRDPDPDEPAAVVEAVVVSSTCLDSYRRLANVWDAGTKAALSNRFAGGSRDVKMWWADTATTLDDFATTWAVGWDTACHHDDQAPEPLRYAQRLTCLENAFLDLRAGLEALATTEVQTLADGFEAGTIDGMRGRKLVDCENPRVLRAQMAAPPLEHRDRVAGLLRDASRAWTQAGIAFSRRSTPDLDRALDRHAAITREVETLDAPSAASLIADRATMLAEYAFDVDQQRRPAAREVLRDGLRRIERSGDSVAIASAYVALGRIEKVVGDGDPAAKLGALMPEIEAAVERAGEPVIPRVRLALLRGELAMRQGRFADAIPLLRAAVELGDHTSMFDSADMHRLLFHALIENGDASSAVRESELWVASETRRHSPEHALATGALMVHAMTLDAAGKLEDAVAAREQLAKVMRNLGAHAPIWGRAYTLGLEHRLGRRSASTADTLRILVGTTPPRHNSDGPATVRRAGMFELYAYSVEQGMTDEDRKLDHAAILAFQRGDRAAMARHARVVVERCKAKSCNDWIRFSRWLAVLADSKSVDADLATLERDYSDKSALAYSGIVLASLGRWADARIKLEAARATPNIWESQSDLTELDAWLGLARVRAGDLAGARNVFEEALATMSIWNNGFDGFSYMTPMVQMALAEILWKASNEDRPRARRLVERAIKGFARLGPGRVAEKAAAEQWRADHGE